MDFYKRKNVVEIAKDLIGKIIVTNFNNKVTSGRVVETEAYAGLTDKASHAFAGRRTPRNEAMYHGAGTVYVYICYGIHRMLNVVTNEINVPDAVLIRAVDPMDGIETMLERTGKIFFGNTLTKGPGNVAKALGIAKENSGLTLFGDAIYLANDRYLPTEEEIGISSRIGIDYAGPDRLLPYRFYLRGNKFVSGRVKA